MVRFNQYLEQHKLQEWKFHYINYYQLKSYLKENLIDIFDRSLDIELSKVENFYRSQIDSLAF